MQKNRIAVQPDEPIDFLLQRLEEAIGRAKSWDFDLPASAATARARSLFRCLASSGLDVSGLEVSVGADGAIAIAASNGTFSTTFEIEPRTGASELIITDERAKTVLAATKQPSDAEIV